MIPVEIELKLALPQKRSNRLLRLPLLKSLSISRPKIQHLYSIYFDTPDLFLKSNGIALRVRRDGKRWIQTIKDQGHISAGLFQHRECEMPVKNGQPDYTNITDTDLKKIFSNPVIRQKIKPIFLTQFTRITHLLQLEDSTRIEFCLDRGTISTDWSKMPFCELELELESGNTIQLFQFALTLQKVFPFSLRLENISKAERGYILSSGRKTPPVKATRIRLNADMCVKMAFKTIYWNCLGHLSSNEYGLRSKRDIEYLNQTCLALKRQRFALKIFLEILPKRTIKPIMRELKWLTTQFSLARDWGVLVIKILPAINNRFSSHQGISILIEASKQLHHKHYKIVRQLVKSKRYLRLMLKIGVWLNDEEFIARNKSLDTLSLANHSILEFSNSLLSEQHQRMKKSKKIKTLNTLELRALRATIIKQCYATEFFADLYPKSEINPYLRSLYNFQRILDVTRNNAIINSLLNELKIGIKGQEINEAIGIILGWNECDSNQMDSAWITFNTIRPFWTSIGSKGKL